VITIIILNIDIPFIYGRSSYWVVPAPAYIKIGDFTVFTSRTALLQIPTWTLFRFAAYPFDLLKAVSSTILLSTIFYYRGVPFKIRVEAYEAKNIGRVYGKIFYTPSFKVLNQPKFLIAVEEVKHPRLKSNTIAEAYNTLKGGMYKFQEISSKLNLNNLEAYYILRRLAEYKYAVFYIEEFNFTYYKAVLKSLYLVSHDGRSLLSYAFSEELTTEPVLVAGMLSAISSFVKETTKSRELLRTVDHGDTTLLVEYGRYSFAALLADRETTELRGKLQKYINEFEKKYEKILADWNGDVEPFEGEAARIIELFSE
jgi:hypothetical protein